MSIVPLATTTSNEEIFREDFQEILKRSLSKFREMSEQMSEMRNE